MSRRRSWLQSSAWIPHRAEMLVSPAWTGAPAPLRRIIDRLEVEHLRHGGMNNGELYVSFGQFVAAGVSRRNVASLLDLGAALGLIETFRINEVAGDIRAPNRYRLTYVPARGKQAPTDEWKAVTADKVASALGVYRRLDRVGSEAIGKQRRAA